MQMQTLKGKDLQLFEDVVSLSQPALHKVMTKYLKKHYKKVKSTIDYVYAEGNIPIALVAHMDTVFPTPPDEVYYDTHKNVMWSPDGLGADDRVGVWMIIKIIQSGLRPHVILTTDEESGCIGASMLTHDYPECPFKDLRYLIQLDRRGDCDCVFYECENPDFEKYIESFGFTTALGSFTDICMICPDWKIAGVNLSVGYKGEHSKSETLYVQSMLKTLNKVINMLKAKDIPTFKFIPSEFTRYYGCYGGWEYGYGTGSLFSTHGSSSSGLGKYRVQCAECKQVVVDLEAFPTKKLGGGTVFYCKDCVSTSEKIDWCLNCGECFEVEDDSIYCEDCRKAKEKEKVNNV